MFKHCCRECSLLRVESEGQTCAECLANMPAPTESETAKLFYEMGLRRPVMGFVQCLACHGDVCVLADESGAIVCPHCQTPLHGTVLFS